MYKAHFKFREFPFGVTPDPQFYYTNAVYREAWATLRYGIEERKGFIVIAGEAGTGKTTLLRKALHEFPPNIKAAYIPNTLVSFSGLLRLILKDLDLPSSTADKFDMMEQLNQYLLEQFHSGHTVALLIDEAQELSLQCLEELRLLGNLETDKHKLLQIVLVGQPELERKLNQPELRQLKQRIVLRCRLRPVDASEVGSYMESRLQTTGRRCAELFDPEAIEKIAYYSKGFPRLINIICDNALLTAYAVSKSKVSAAMIDEVADDLLIDESRVAPEDAGPIRGPVEKKASFKSAPAQDEPTTKEGPPPGEVDEPSEDIKTASQLWGKDIRTLRPIFTMSAAMVVMVALAGFLFSQRGPLLVSNSKEKIPANLDDGRKEMAQVKSPVAEAELLAVKPQSISSAPHLEPAYVSDQKIVGARPEKSTNGPAVNEIAAVHSVAKTPMPRNGKKLVGSPRSDKEDAGSNSANFLVVGASFVRANPSANAKIITTLAPGTPIEVTGPAGEYFRVRALGTDTIRGYVHREDAFFERK